MFSSAGREREQHLLYSPLISVMKQRPLTALVEELTRPDMCPVRPAHPPPARNTSVIMTQKQPCSSILTSQCMMICRESKTSTKPA
ncbi:hypothetical protein R3I94_002458 [Phoxinus phoxinus]